MAQFQLIVAGGTTYLGPDEQEAKFEYHNAIVDAITRAAHGLDDSVELYRDGRLLKAYRDGVATDHEAH